MITKEEALKLIAEANKLLESGALPPWESSNQKGTGLITELSKLYGVHRKTIDKYLKQAEIQYGLVPNYKIKKLSEDYKLNKLEKENKILKEKLNKLQEEKNHIEEVKAFIHGSISNQHNPKFSNIFPDDTNSEEIPCTIWSDWHIGEIVKRSQVGGVNEYNLAIAKNRVELLVKRTIDICKNHKKNKNFEYFVIFLLGDIISGSIHEELGNTNEVYDLQSIIEARDLLISGINELLKHFPKILIACTPGNHGRTTKRSEAKDHAYKNYDWIIYQIVSKHFEGDNRVAFVIPDAGECLVRVLSTTYLVLHGDMMGVKGGDGIIGALGPIMRGEIKIRNSYSQIDHAYDILCIGHWHQALKLPRAIVNNTIKGYDEYAKKILRAPFSHPSQVLWFTHIKYGVVDFYEVFVDNDINQSLEKVDSKIGWNAW